MTELTAAQALTLAQWLSPGYPVGAFVYSHGLETATAGGGVTDAAGVEAWARDALEHGAGRSDAILLAHAMREDADLDALSGLATALAPAAERRLETEAQGAAFAMTTAAAFGPEAAQRPYPVALGAAARAHGLPAVPVIAAYLQALAQMIVSAGVRLVPLGQTEGQAVLARLAPLCLALAEEVADIPLEDTGGAAFVLDIAAQHHETLQPRLFRS